MTFDRIDSIVVPAIRRLLTNSEFEELSVVSDGGDLETLIAQVQACGETLSVVVCQSGVIEDLESAKARVFEELQDQVAESAFAWGQQRGSIDGRHGLDV